MFQSLWTAGTSLLVQQNSLDIIANNLNNIDTPGFKQSRTNFSDIFYTALSKPTVKDNLVGTGVRLSAVTMDMTTGHFQQTDRSLDFAIEGEGYLQLRLPDGTIGYMKSGSIVLDSSRQLVTREGYQLVPPITVPMGTQEPTLDKDGTIKTFLTGDGNTIVLGKLSMAKFLNPEGLQKIGGNIWIPSGTSGQPQAGLAQEEGFGVFVPGYLEMSNVNVAQEMVNIMMVQRVYEFSAKTMKNADDMLGMANAMLQR